MTAYVVDTNVAVVANGGQEVDTELECRLACVEALEEAYSRQIVLVDDKGLLFDEYKKHLTFADAQRVGNKFFKHIWSNQYRQDRVRRVPITPCDDIDDEERRGFEELPENHLDISDRKFLATALVGEAVILNATDGDWAEQRDLTTRLGVTVRQLCPNLPQNNP